jgi:hypothetical protein
VANQGIHRFIAEKQSSWEANIAERLSHLKSFLALYGVIILHPEDKSLSPDGESGNAYTRGLLLRRPVQAIIPLIPIGKEIERKSQEGEDISVLDNVGPVKYYPRKTANTRPADAALIQRAIRFPKKFLRRESGVSQHAIDRFFRGERVHPATRAKLNVAVEKLERSDH